MSVKLRKKKVAGGKISLYLDIYHNGQRQYEFLKLYLFKGTNTATKVANNETLVLAETITAKRQIEINHSEYGLIPKFKKEADFVEYFKTIGQRKGRSVNIWKNTLNHLKTFTGGKVAFKNINERWLEKYQDYLLKQVSRNSAHTYYSKIKAALNHAVRDKIIQSNPCKRVQNIRKEDTEIQFLTFEEIQVLSRAIPKTESGKEVARMFLFGCFTGLSLANLETLTYEQIEGESVKFFRTKTEKWIYFPLNKTALSLIGNTVNKEPSARIFNTPQRRHASRLLKKWGGQAGIKKNMHYHIARHTFATLSLTSGADLYTVSKLIGHKNLSTTQIYAEVIDSVKRQAVNNLPQLEL